MDKNRGDVALGKKRVQNLHKKLGSDEVLKEYMRQVRAGKKLSCPSPLAQRCRCAVGAFELVRNVQSGSACL